MRVLVTGASGFLGGALVRRLAVRADLEVIPLVRSAVDLRDRAAVDRILAEIRPQAVIHAAGRTPGRPGALLDDNAIATANLAEAIGMAAPEAGLVLLGSAAQYGVSETETPWRESDPCIPFEPYGISKQTAEQCALAAARRWGSKTTALRLFNVISAEPAGEQVFAAFLRKAAAQSVGPPPWRVPMGPLMALRDFVQVDDVLEAVQRVIDRQVWGEVINVCTGVGRTARALLGATVAQLGGRVVIEEAPPQVQAFPWSVGDPSRCEALLGLRPSSDLAPVARRAAAWLIAAADAADA